jgi:adenosylhomocysteine nucleosidase
MRSLLLLLLVCNRAPGAYDVLVQAAIEPELKPLLAALEDASEVRIGAWTFWTGHISGRGGSKSVVVSRTEVGPINAAAATALAIQAFHPGVIINQGTAGASNPELRLWDIVLGERATDYGAFTAEHGDAGTGTSPERWKPLAHSLRIEKELVKFPSFPSDPGLIEAALKLKYERGRVRKGNIGSAYQYNRELDRITWLHNTYGIDSEDMESAFSAGVAAGMKVRFLAIRIISDSEWTHPKFEPSTAEACAQFALELIRAWPGRLSVAARPGLQPPIMFAKE